MHGRVSFSRLHGSAGYFKNLFWGFPSGKPFFIPSESKKTAYPQPRRYADYFDDLFAEEIDYDAEKKQ